MAYEITIADPAGVLEASFVPELGMIGTSLRHHGEELLYQREGLAAYARSGSIYGIPLLYPWANRLSAWEFEIAGQRVTLDPDSPITHRDAPTGTPIHGLLAASPHWTLTDADRHTLTAELDFGAVPEYLTAFPFPQRLRYTATIAGSSLSVELTIAATSERPVPISFGFHPYLTLPGSDRRNWQVQIPVARQALVDDRQIPTGETEAIPRGALDGPLADRTFDTSFPELWGGEARSGDGESASADADSPPTFVLADGRRRLTLTQWQGYPVTQVYAPEDSDFICYEPMTAPVNALISGDGLNWVEPGGEFTGIFIISVE